MRRHSALESVLLDTAPAAAPLPRARPLTYTQVALAAVVVGLCLASFLLGRFSARLEDRHAASPASDLVLHR